MTWLTLHLFLSAAEACLRDPLLGIILRHNMDHPIARSADVCRHNQALDGTHVQQELLILLRLCITGSPQVTMDSRQSRQRTRPAVAA